MKEYFFWGLALFFVAVLLSFAYSSFREVDTSHNNSYLIIPEKPGTILATALNYDDLNATEKKLIDIFLEKNPTYESYLRDLYSDNFKNGVKLKFYDKKIVLLYIPTGKVGYEYHIYDINSWTKLNTKDITVFVGTIDTKEYIFSAYENKIFYFRIGMIDFELLEGSELRSKDESYVKSVGPGGPTYELSFNENTNTLTASVFKSTEPDNGLYLKLREVQFVLE